MAVDIQIGKYYPLGNQLIPYGTPLHVTELFLQVLKITFAEFPQDYPYRYVPDDYDATGIAFDVALNKESGMYGKKPIVVVNRGEQSSSPMNIGDFAGAHIPTNYKVGSNVYASTISIQVASRVKAEVEIIVQHIFSLIMMHRTRLPRILGVHAIQSVSFAEVQKMEDDDTMFLATGGFSYMGQYIWTQTEQNPILKSIGMTVDRLLRE